MNKRVGWFGFLIALLILMISCGSGTVFQKFYGLDTISRKGLTDLWDQSLSATNELTGANVTITILESYYNDDAIWVGYKLEGKEIVPGGQCRWVGPLFYYDGEMIFNSKGLIHSKGVVQNVRYGVSRLKADKVKTLPEICKMKLVFYDKYDWYNPNRKIEFEITLTKKSQKVKELWD